MVSPVGIVLAVVGLALLFAPSKEFTQDISRQFLVWVTEPNAPGKVTENWFGSDLDMVVKIIGGYFLLVAAGLLIKKDGEEEGKVSAIVDAPVKALQLIYNLAQCILCSYMIYKAIEHYINHKYVPICNAFDVKEAGMASVLQIFYLSKILDFFDTLFIVLRQKWRQLSFLHIYHHASIFLVYWMNFSAAYDGDIYLTIVLNSFVHLVMYSYYFLSTLGYSAWWKNYITLLQMGQFILMNAQAIYIIFFGCPFPLRITWIYLGYIITLFALFRNFYTRTYTKRPVARGKKE